MEPVALFIFVFVVVILFIYGYRKLEESYHTPKIAIPFKESIDLTGLPVVTFDNMGTKLHLLIDSGSDCSVMDSEAMELCKVKEVKSTAVELTTGSGALDANALVVIPISYKDFDFDGEFLICDMKEQFESAFGGKIKVHGLLGSNFFRKYKYKIDYSDLAVYAKK